MNVSLYSTRIAIIIVGFYNNSDTAVVLHCTVEIEVVALHIILLYGVECFRKG